ncbi:MAG: proline iminopeptidase-family hydrolase [Acidobacteriota bacterium]
MARVTRRTFLESGAAALAGGTLTGSAGPAEEGRPPSGSETFRRLTFPEGRPVPGPEVAIRTAGVRRVPVAAGKHRVWTRRVGSGRTPVLALHGGPGGTHEALECLGDYLPGEGCTLYYYDQLGCGNSDRPADDSLWTVSRYAEEVEEVRAALGLTDFVLYGHSFGGMLAIEYALSHPKRLKALVLSNVTASVSSHVRHVNRLRTELPAEVRSVLDRCEREGPTQAPEYREALMGGVYPRHLCRLAPWPEPLERSFRNQNTRMYELMNGPSELAVTGRIKDWDRWSDLHRIGAPTLLLAGYYDTVNPADIRRMARLLPNSRAAVCTSGSHYSLWDDQEAYFRHLTRFLRQVRDGSFAPEDRRGPDYE